jgi:EAL domain-containing protein (putative c-di-GMP-specific phosphodiesterase class I)
VAVNVAAAQLTNRNFARSVVGIMEQSGLAPERLKIEITESSLITENQQVREQLEQLRTERIRVALDYFGTGFSSLSYLKDLPIDELKIDQSFVRAMDSGARSVAIVETILRLARDLGLSTTAEGVETTAQAAILRELGCDYYQGYLYAKPLSREELLAFEPT